LIPVFGFANATIVEGSAFTTAASGIRADALDYPGLDAFVLVDSQNAERYRPKAGTDGATAITALEAKTIAGEALKIANRARAQIRRPTNSQARVTISVVDTNGQVLALVRTRDAPIFGIDVSLQKARTASFFSGAFASSDVSALPRAAYLAANGALSGVQINLSDYLSATRTQLADSGLFSNGQIAWTPRAIGNIARPFYPDGVDGAANGALSKPFANFSPFSDGIQFDLVSNQVNQIVGAYLSAQPTFETANPSLPILTAALAQVVNVRTAGCTQNIRNKNGIQIFPGASPIYRGDTLVGAIGISGDGIDQDDMIAFLGLYNAGRMLNSNIGHAPAARRADQLATNGAHLRYVQCPQAPFLDSTDQNVCAGK
jgi:uncharacterized protein GlcG (DUF336 family)